MYCKGKEGGLDLLLSLWETFSAGKDDGGGGGDGHKPARRKHYEHGLIEHAKFTLDLAYTHTHTQNIKKKRLIVKQVNELKARERERENIRFSQPDVLLVSKERRENRFENRNRERERERDRGRAMVAPIKETK